MQFSNFGTKFSRQTGILQLMSDVDAVLAGDTPVNMLGVGNPARIPAVEEHFSAIFHSLADELLAQVVSYSSPQGETQFLDALVDFFNQQYGWGLSRRNIALTNGSQNTFFYLFNLFGGAFPDGSQRKILLPLVPEYIGYGDLHVDGCHFTAVQPDIEQVTFQGESGFFKYHVDFQALAAHPDLAAGRIGAICCSRPTNPTGNVLSDTEMAELSALAQHYHLPLIVDNAYGLPFPNIMHVPATLQRDAQTILCFSLSKLGLPGVRCGIIIADEAVITAVTALNAITNLAPTRFGALLATPLLQENRIGYLSDHLIRPYYAEQTTFALNALREAFADTPLRIHKPEGAIFLWLWFPDLPITTTTLYQQLKAKGTIIIPGEYFFPGIDVTDYPHAHECIRMSIACPREELMRGIQMLAETVRAAYI